MLEISKDFEHHTEISSQCIMARKINKRQIIGKEVIQLSLFTGSMISI
jgi:hypothetical protein